MTAKRLFFILILFFVLASVAEVVFYYQPSLEKRQQSRQKLSAQKKKYFNASHARKDIDRQRQLYQKHHQKLDSVKQRFINRDALSEITQKIKRQAETYHLELVDFTPIFKVYFADTSTKAVKPLPFSMVLSGHFLDVGKFLDTWPEMSFYITAHQLFMDKAESKSNRVEAEITGMLYAWRETGDEHAPR
ncbi:MAG: hypothetical protein D6677_01805 [Calditrichaeota bacterium]|nr:MAG: hypothetical protein D6677_01805 [Calditrichota bacterium]